MKIYIKLKSGIKPVTTEQLQINHEELGFLELEKQVLSKLKSHLDLERACLYGLTKEPECDYYMLEKKAMPYVEYAQKQHDLNVEQTPKMLDVVAKKAKDYLKANGNSSAVPGNLVYDWIDEFAKNN